MDNPLHDSIVRQTIMNSIDREELLLKKYDDYNTSIRDDEFNNLINEFKETSSEHVNLLKSKLQKLSL